VTSKFDFSESDYIEVAKRIDAFRAKHPEGTLQVRIVELPEAFADKFIAVEAAAFRNMDDTRPGIELAWEPVPGATPFTKNSELQNAATSAIGRALIAVGAASSKGASFEEVRNRRAENTSLAGEPGDALRPPGVETASAPAKKLAGSGADRLHEADLEGGLTPGALPDFTIQSGPLKGYLASEAAYKRPKVFAAWLPKALEEGQIPEADQAAAIARLREASGE